MLNKRLIQIEHSMNPTQIKLIEAAEREFAERGFHGASIREITARAGANVAAVNYHFSSKEGLFIAMIRHRIEPINAARLDWLEEELAASDGEPLPLEKIVDIIIRPLVAAFHKGSGSRAFIKAMERGMSEEEKFSKTLYQDVLGKLIATFRYELGRTLAYLPADAVDQCFAYLGSCVSGAFQHCPQSGESNSNLTFPDAERLGAFIVGGIKSLIDLEQT